MMVKRKKRYRIYLAAVIVCVVVFLGIFAHLFNGAPVGSTTFKAVITNIQEISLLLKDWKIIKEIIEANLFSASKKKPE